MHQIIHSDFVIQHTDQPCPVICNPVFNNIGTQLGKVIGIKVVRPLFQSGKGNSGIRILIVFAFLSAKMHIIFQLVAFKIQQINRHQILIVEFQVINIKRQNRMVEPIVLYEVFTVCFAEE